MRPKRCPICKRQPVRFVDKIDCWPHELYGWKCESGDHYCTSETFQDREDALIDWNTSVDTGTCIEFNDTDNPYCHKL